MTEQKYSIGVNKEDFDKFVALYQSRQEDRTRADTFHFLMTNFEATIA